MIIHEGKTISNNLLFDFGYFIYEFYFENQNFNLLAPKQFRDDIQNYLPDKIDENN